MSGIVGIINFDRAPVDRGLLARMTDLMAGRGPDAQEIWVRGNVGFGHAMLRTTFESEMEKQPCSLDDQVWITADARLDGRADLVRKLESRGRMVAVSLTTDVELILHAYHAWGENCLDHLLGDFSFAIWDARDQKLFCARDHFGVKLFYYSRAGNSLIFSNALDCVRLHPAVSDRLNDAVIGDFLLFGFNKDTSITSFADIGRLPPGHSLVWSKGSLRIRPYWSLPTDAQPLRYREPGDYVDHFRELLSHAVSDRLRTEKVAIWMSGGMDSTTIAATACELRQKTGAPFDVRAYCSVYDSLMPDEERYYSGLAAKALGIPVVYLPLDDYKPFDRWDEPELRRPEPIAWPTLASSVDCARRTAGYSRVVLDGEDGDALLATGSAIDMLLQGMSLRETAVALAKYAGSHRWPPPPGIHIVRNVKQRLKRKEQPALPHWLNRDFVAKCDLPERSEHGPAAKAGPIWPARREVHRRLTQPMWQMFFEYLDGGVTGPPLEVRLPFLDLRLVNYLQAIPALPWRVKKELARTAMRGRLPVPVLERRKTALAGDPVLDRLRKPDAAECLNGFAPAPGIDRYVDPKALPNIRNLDDARQAWALLRVFCLNRWLQNLKEVSNNNPEKEKEHEYRTSETGEKALSAAAVS